MNKLIAISIMERDLNAIFKDGLAIDRCQESHHAACRDSTDQLT